MHFFQSATCVLAIILFREHLYIQGVIGARSRNGDSQNKGVDVIFATLEANIFAVVVLLSLDSSISIAELRPAATDVPLITKQRYG